MAIYVFCFQHGSRAKGHTAWGHARYILRLEEYSKYNRNEFTFGQSGSLPSWAHDERHFWQSVDKHEFAHARLYSEFVVAIPRELARDQQIELIQSFTEKELGNRYPYTFGIHTRPVAFGEGTNPHAHIMFSNRRNDDINRDERVYFKRVDFGGARKDPEFIPKQRLFDLRESWALSANQALEKAGREERITEKSLADQGINRRPHPKLTPFETMLYRQGIMTEKVADIKALRLSMEVLEQGAKVEKQHQTALQDLKADLEKYQTLDYLREQRVAIQREHLIEQTRRLTLERQELEAEIKHSPYGQLIALERALDEAHVLPDRKEIERQLEAVTQQVENPARRQESMMTALTRIQAVIQELEESKAKLEALPRSARIALFSGGQKEEEYKHEQQQVQGSGLGLGLALGRSTS